MEIAITRFINGHFPEVCLGLFLLGVALTIWKENAGLAYFGALAMVLLWLML